MFEELSLQNAQDSFKIHRTVQHNPWSEAVFLDCLTPPYFAYKLCVSGKLQGYYIGLQVLDEITLMDIAVAGEYQSQGVGRCILAHFIEQCRLRKGTEIWLEVRESNIAAHQLYISLGFTLIEKRKDYYPSKDGAEAALIMKLALIAPSL